MKKAKIMKEFSVLSENIVDILALEKYVDFCITNSKKDKIKGETTSHHILPAAETLPFKKFKNLKENPWNLSELTFADHYKAHYMLMKAIDHFSTVFAFAAMHNKDLKLKRISEIDLIEDCEFQKIWAKRNEKIKERLAEIVFHDGKYITRAKKRALSRKISIEERAKISKRMSGENNIIKNDGVFDKMRKTKIERNMDKIGAERAAKTMKEKVDGVSIYDKTAMKIKEKKLQIQENGKTLAWNANQKTHRKLREKSKKYRLLNVFDENFEKILPAYEIRRISPGLETKTQDNYLGKSKYAKTIYRKNGKENLIGLFCERIQ